MELSRSERDKVILIFMQNMFNIRISGALVTRLRLIRIHRRLRARVPIAAAAAASDTLGSDPFECGAYARVSVWRMRFYGNRFRFHRRTHQTINNNLHLPSENCFSLSRPPNGNSIFDYYYIFASHLSPLFTRSALGERGAQQKTEENGNH